MPEKSSKRSAVFETGKREEAWSAKWVSCSSEEKRHPYFEKKIIPAKEVAKARLYICGLGLYEVFVDEKRVGNEYLTPYSNDYNEWVQYQTYDVTEEFSSEGTLRVLLGNGWYKARFGFSAFEDKGFYGNDWKLIAELHLMYTDGSEEVIGTDETWQVQRSKISFSNLYDGEHRDDTLPDLPAEQAVLCDAPKGELTDRMSLPVTIHETFRPKELIHTPAGELVSIWDRNSRESLNSMSTCQKEQKYMFRQEKFCSTAISTMKICGVRNQNTFIFRMERK